MRTFEETCHKILVFVGIKKTRTTISGKPNQVIGLLHFLVGSFTDGSKGFSQNLILCAQ